MVSQADRGVKVYHALQKGIVWHAFVVTDIADKCGDVKDFEDEVNAIVIPEHAPVAEYKGALFVRGQYDSRTLEVLREKFRSKLPQDSYEELQGDYSKFLSRYKFWKIIDSRLSADQK